MSELYIVYLDKDKQVLELFNVTHQSRTMKGAYEVVDFIEYEKLQAKIQSLEAALEYCKDCFEIIPECSSDSAIKQHAKRGLDKCLLTIKEK